MHEDFSDDSLDQLLPPQEVAAAILAMIETWPQDHFHRNPKYRVEFYYSYALSKEPGEELPGFELDDCYAVTLNSGLSFMKNASAVFRTENLIKMVRENLPNQLIVGRWKVTFFPDLLENRANSTELLYGIKSFLNVVK